jgi:DNA-binding transcriptional LysR family regulator
MDRGKLADLTAFIAVADRLSFRGAASQLGVTPSALSHSMRQLEERLDVRLLHRTTRSVSVTDAGQRLLDRLRPAIDQIAGALEDLNEERERPMGRLRIYAVHLAAAAVVAPIWGRFLSTYPDVHLELAAGEATIDIVAKGFDAGIGPRDRVPTDMIAVRVTGPMKIAVVGAPTYFAKRRPPRTPDDLARHSCIQYRRACNSQRCRFSDSRGGRRARDRVYGRSRGRALPAFRAIDTRARRLVAVVRGIVPLLSRAATGPGYVTRVHRHDPHGARPGTAQTFAPESFYQGLSDCRAAFY